MTDVSVTNSGDDYTITPVFDRRKINKISITSEDDGEASGNVLTYINKIEDTSTNPDGITIYNKKIHTDGNVSTTNPLATKSTVTEAISGLAQVMRFRGVSTTDPGDGTITINNEVLTPTIGDVVIYETDRNEWVYDGSKWVELGDENVDTAYVNNLIKSYVDTELNATDTKTAASFVDSVTQSKGVISITRSSLNDQPLTFTQASSFSNIQSGEKVSVIMGKIRKVIANLISHIDNKSNPHEVTAAQTGAMQAIQSTTEPTNAEEQTVWINPDEDDIASTKIKLDGQWIQIAGATSPKMYVGATANSDGSYGYVPAPKAGDEGKFLKGDGTWGTLVPNKITLIASEGQASFSIPFKYDSLSSNLTVYYNGILMKEIDNYTVDTTSNTVNLVDFSAEAGDIVTIMGILGAQSVDFSQEAINAINEINSAVSAAQSDINSVIANALDDIAVNVSEAETAIDTKVQDAEDTINLLLADLPSNWDTYLTKNAPNVMGASGKITMNSAYTPSNNYDVTTKAYVDNAINTATASIVTDIWVASTTSPTNTKLLWIDTNNSNILKYYNGSAWTPVSVAWT